MSLILYFLHSCPIVELAERERKLFAIFLLRDNRVEFANDGSAPDMLPYSPFQRIVVEFPVRLVSVA